MQMGLEGTCILLEFSSQKNIEHMLSGAELSRRSLCHLAAVLTTTYKWGGNFMRTFGFSISIETVTTSVGFFREFIT